MGEKPVSAAAVGSRAASRGEPTRDKLAAFIRRYTDEHGVSPSVREMADDLDVSTTAINGHLSQMEKQGRIVRDGPRTRRGVEYRAMW